MSVPSIGPISLPNLTPTASATTSAATSMATGAATTDATTPTAATDDFAAALGRSVSQGLDAVQQTQRKAEDLATQAATGQLTDVHDYMIAATDAELTTEMTVALRNKAIEAFTDIMRMPI